MPYRVFTRGAYFSAYRCYAVYVITAAVPTYRANYRDRAALSPSSRHGNAAFRAAYRDARRYRHPAALPGDAVPAGCGHSFCLLRNHSLSCTHVAVNLPHLTYRAYLVYLPVDSVYLLPSLYFSTAPVLLLLPWRTPPSSPNVTGCRATWLPTRCSVAAVRLCARAIILSPFCFCALTSTAPGVHNAHNITIPLYLPIPCAFTIQPCYGETLNRLLPPTPTCAHAITARVTHDPCCSPASPAVLARYSHFSRKRRGENEQLLHVVTLSRVTPCL